MLEISRPAALHISFRRSGSSEQPSQSQLLEVHGYSLVGTEIAHVPQLANGNSIVKMHSHGPGNIWADNTIWEKFPCELCRLLFCLSEQYTEAGWWIQEFSARIHPAVTTAFWLSHSGFLCIPIHYIDDHVLLR